MAPRFRLMAAAAAIALLPAGSASSTTASGLYGMVRKGPVMPVCQQGVPCDAPAQLTLVFSPLNSPGPNPVTIRSDKKGRYRIALQPGYYSVRTTKKIGTTKLPRPHAVHVRAGHWDRINLYFDTGIR